jgi:methylaspartate ammonia-lyase
VYGTFGIIFENKLSRIINYLADLEEAAKPFPLRIECPVDAGSREGQVEALKTICQLLAQKGLSVEIVADEWCNTLEDIELFAREKAGHMIQIKVPDLGGINNSIQAVLYCKAKGVKAYQGGSCAETDVAARISTQVALSTQPCQILAKPGMGVDEGYMIVKNEMARTIALLKSKAITR